MSLRKNHRQLIDEATEKITTLGLEEAETRQLTDGVLFVDIRDARELDRDGQIPGAFHAPRGMLEFWVDPESPYYKPPLGEADELVLYCGSGWRSALATAALVDMGVDRIAHVDGGFAAWKASGRAVVDRERHARP